jgi:hypothetical protein
MSDRDWKQINEGLVRRGELLLDLDFVRGWGRELRGMNRGKEGGRYLYPESFIRLLLFLHAYLHLPYRQLEGFTRALSRYVEGLKAPDHSTIQWRAGKLQLSLDQALADPVGDLVIALDASGIKVTNRGEWKRRRWKARRGYLKVHIAVDVKQKRIVSLEVTDERTGDGGMLQPLVEEASGKGKVVKVLADGAYDSKENFRYSRGRG